MGRPPLPDDERGKRTNIYLSAELLVGLEELKQSTGEGTSALFSRLLTEALTKLRRKKPK